MEHKKRGCVISPDNGSKVGLKAQKLLAQGIALGNVDKKQSRPERAKALKYWAIYKAFALTGRLVDCHYTQGDALGYELLGLQPVLEPHAKLQLLITVWGTE